MTRAQRMEDVSMVEGHTDPALPRPRDPIGYLSEVLSSRVRAHVLPYLIARNDQAFSLTQIARGLGISVSSVQHECYKLERLGILHGRPVQGSRRYQINHAFPPANALIAFVRSVFEPGVMLSMALTDLTGQGLHIAALAGPLPPEATEPPYLLLVGDLSLDQLDVAQQRVSYVLDLPVDALRVAFFQPDQWHAHLASGNDFVARLRALPQIPILDVSP